MNRLSLALLFLMSQLAFADENPIAGVTQPIVDIGAGAHIKGPLVVRDIRTGEVIFSVRPDSELDVEAGSTGVQLFPRQ